MVERLLEHSAQVDVIDLAGRIIANPRRNAIGASTAEVVSLAYAVERFWAIAIEAEILVRALQREQTGNDQDENERDEAIQAQMDCIDAMMAALRGATSLTENEDGSDHS